MRLELIEPHLEEAQTGIGVLPEEVLESAREQGDPLIRQSAIETHNNRCQLVCDVRECLLALSTNKHDILGGANDFRGDLIDRTGADICRAAGLPERASPDLIGGRD